MALRTRKFETLAAARAFHKKHKADFPHGRPAGDWHIRKIPNARKLKYFVGSDVEWLNL